jgi:CRISPR-associated protein (TIGR02584 family)
MLCEKQSNYLDNLGTERRVLLCVTGLSPQVVTETLYALAVKQTPPWIPHEIFILTTQRGADNARLMLLSDKPGWFHQLCKDYQLPPIAFDASHIEVLTDASGQALVDIRDDQDNSDAADCIARLVRRLTHDAGTVVHASIAGGRKTMGFFLGYAMSLWGRPQDRLSHVLVSPDFESRPEFFYPTPYTRVIAGGKGQDPIDAANARIWLGDIPFVRLRQILPLALRETGGSFADAVRAANTALGDVRLDIDIDQKNIRINDCPLALPPTQFALLALLAWRLKQGEQPLRAPFKEADDDEWRSLVLHGLKACLGEFGIPQTLYEKLNGSAPVDGLFSQQLAKLERAIKTSGVLPWQRLIERVRQRGSADRQRGYRLALHPNQVTFSTEPKGRSKLAKA